MWYLAAALTLATTLNLALTYGVIRRLREHTELLSDRPSGQPAPIAIAQPGERPDNLSDVDGIRLVVFLSPQCGPCKELAPQFAAYASGFPGEPDSVLAVVADEGPEAVELAGPLRDVARVRFEPPGGPLAKSFRVKGFPSWCILDEHGVVQRSGTGVDTLPSAVPA